MLKRVLVVDDNESECQFLVEALANSTTHLHFELSGAQALEVLSYQSFDVVITDLRMPRMDGLTLCKHIVSRWPNLPVVIVTAFGAIESAVEAMKSGAYDFITKPFDVDAITLVLERAAEHHQIRVELEALRRLVTPSHRFGPLLGSSSAMQRLYDQIELANHSASPILISGERGTGKDVVARLLHQRTQAMSAPFVAIHCGAIAESNEGYSPTDCPPTSLASLFVRAEGGTLLLDEVADLSHQNQRELLRALNRQANRASDDNCGIRLPSHVIALTSSDLQTEIELGRFENPLYCLLSQVQLEVPPLRVRRGDILLLAQAFLAEIALQYGRSVRGFTPTATELLHRYVWPGNVRELRFCVESAVTIAQGELVDVGDLPATVREFRPNSITVAGSTPSEFMTLDELERQYILRVLSACADNRSLAARVLGIGRKTLYRKMQKIGLPAPDGDSLETSS